LLIAAGGLCYSGIVLVLSRRRLISLRYTLGWMFIAALGVVGAALTPLILPVADLFGMSPTGVLLAAATTVLLTITLQLSVSVSGMQRQLRTIIEAHALLQHEVAAAKTADADQSRRSKALD
jgi:hypothetical protein